MGLIVLGKTKDEKGAQLEQLTRILLKHQGYSSIITNVQVGGGSELDVTAVKKDPTGIKDITTPVLCECKAHQSPITLPDWLKFIGKLSIERRKNERTIGLMLALSGANGSVIGSYNDDFSGDETVQLIANDDLLSLIKDVYHISSLEDVKRTISSIKGVEVEDIDLAFYKNKIYWLLVLGNNRYTICKSDGTFADKKSVKDLIPLLQNEISFEATEYIDVFEEFELQRRINTLKVKIINELANGRKVSKKVIDGFSREVGAGRVNMDDLVKDDSFLTLVRVNNRKRIQLRESYNISDFFRFVLTVGTPVELLTSGFYQSHINDLLVEEIWRIQGGFQVDEQDKDKCLCVFRLSPSALLYGLNPDRMLASYQAFKNNDVMRLLYQSHFKSQLTKCLEDDFQNQVLHPMYIKLGVENATVETSIRMGNNGDGLFLESKQSFKLVRIDDSDQVGIVVTIDNSVNKA